MARPVPIGNVAGIAIAAVGLLIALVAAWLVPRVARLLDGDFEHTMKQPR